ncbi:MAG: DsrE family protein [Cocleimonas sp.]|nr:DsrE family protein [Cocleimonas sp.]
MSITIIIKRVIYALLLVMLLNSPTVVALEENAPEGVTTRLVIQISENDPLKQKLALSNVYNLQKFYGMDNIEIEVVAYGPGISLLYPDGKEASRVRSLMAQDVIFTGCQNTLDTIKANTGKEQKLIEDVEIVRAGIARIIDLQGQGYRYLHP